MTISKRIYFEPSDILAIQLECKKCGTIMSIHVKDWKPAVSRCPNCSVPLIEDLQDVSAVKGLAEALNILLTLGDKLSFHLRLEFNQPD
jgi:hypothetical protein